MKIYFKIEIFVKIIYPHAIWSTKWQISLPLTNQIGKWDSFNQLEQFLRRIKSPLTR